MSNFIKQLQAWITHKTPLIIHTNPLLILAVILLTGYICTKLARKLHIPIVTAQILGGIIIGPYVLNIFPKNAFAGFAPITDFALGFIGLTIGSHLDFRKLHNAGKRIIYITIFDVIITPTIVFISLYYIAHLSLPVTLLISAISITTAPGSTLHIIKEKRAKGILSKTILAVVALNNVLTILIFYTIYNYLSHNILSTGLSNLQEIDLIATIGKPLILLLESILIGSFVGGSVIYLTEKRKAGISFLALVLLSVIITIGISELFEFSGILSCLILGMIISNFSKYKTMLFSSFRDIEVEVYTLFFVLAGTHFDLEAFKVAGLAGFILIVSRLIGKSLAPTLGAFVAGATKTIKKWIGITLYPIAGLAIGLTFLIENDPIWDPYSAQIIAVVLTSVVVNELLGPIFTGKAIKKSGEEHKNRLRLMDFIQEEFIKIDLTANDKWKALDDLAEFLYKTQNIKELSLENLKKSIIEREKDISTGIGDNIAIPHAIIEGGPKIRGVIGVSRDGIPFDAIDDKKVKILFLIATPEAHYDIHLHVLANISKIFGHHPRIKDKIVDAESPAEVFELLQTEELEKFNPFFED